MWATGRACRPRAPGEGSTETGGGLPARAPQPSPSTPLLHGAALARGRAHILPCPAVCSNCLSEAASSADRRKQDRRAWETAAAAGALTLSISLSIPHTHTALPALAKQPTDGDDDEDDDPASEEEDVEEEVSGGRRGGNNGTPISGGRKETATQSFHPRWNTRAPHPSPSPPLSLCPAHTHRTAMNPTATKTRPTATTTAAATRVPTRPPRARAARTRKKTLKKKRTRRTLTRRTTRTTTRTLARRRR